MSPESREGEKGKERGGKKHEGKRKRTSPACAPDAVRLRSSTLPVSVFFNSNRFSWFAKEEGKKGGREGGGGGGERKRLFGS